MPQQQALTELKKKFGLNEITLERYTEEVKKVKQRYDGRR